MTRTSIVKWAVAALLALPAIPLVAKTPTRLTHHTLTSTSRAHHKLTTSSRHRRYHHTTARHSALSKKAIASHRLASASHRGTARNASAKSHRPFKVTITKMPPTIDGIHA